MKPTSRRVFVKGALASTVITLGALNLDAKKLNYKQNTLQIVKNNINELSGTEFNLTIGYSIVNFTGDIAMATTVNNSLSGPTLVWNEGDEITINVTNNLKETTSIHWHGIILPYQMDGVPDISFDGIKPGETFTYKFIVKQSGTYWYHSHSDYQEQTGVYGVIIINPKQQEPYQYDKDYVVTLSDWSDEKPTVIYRKLKLMSDYYNFNQRTAIDFFQEVKEKGFLEAFSDRKMWNEMEMTDRDLSDVTGYTYTYLMNGNNPTTNWKALFKNGDKVRLRFINASAMTFFDIRIPNLKMTVIAADGNYIKPIDVDEFRIGVAETYDVIVEPNNDTAYTIFAQNIERSGYALGTLTYDSIKTAKIPKLDKPQNLTHADMGMSMEGMDHSNMQMNGNMDHSKMSMDMNNKQTREWTKATVVKIMAEDKAIKVKHSAIPNWKWPEMTMNFGVSENLEFSKFKKDMSMDIEITKTKNNKYIISNVKMSADKIIQPTMQKIPITELPFNEGVQTTMKAEDPQYRLSDPGVGLRNNGRKVLTYADLRNIYSTKHEPQPNREIILHLTGNMERYMWSINGIKYTDSLPLEFKYGERIRITFINDTMMNHPMHMHGMWSDLETGDNNHLVRKHTIVVQPGSKISYRVTVDAKGAWAFHCHLIYHMAGMFRKIVVS